MPKLTIHNSGIFIFQFLFEILIFINHRWLQKTDGVHSELALQQVQPTICALPLSLMENLSYQEIDSQAKCFRISVKWLNYRALQNSTCQLILPGPENINSIKIGRWSCGRTYLPYVCVTGLRVRSRAGNGQNWLYTYNNFEVVTWNHHVSILDPFHSRSRFSSHLTLKDNVHRFMSINIRWPLQKFRRNLKRKKDKR